MAEIGLGQMRHERFQGSGIELHVARAGDGPPIVLLHGFPENWTSWRHQFEPLVRAGFSVWAPDMRGYGGSSCPASRNAYRLRHLVADVVALVNATGSARVHLAGHDWGGIVAWTLAGMHPEIVDRLIVLNAPHLDVYVRQVWRTRQLIRSAYVLLFLIPGLAEAALSAGDYRLIRMMFERTPSRPGAFRAEDVEGYVRALARPGALTAALNYYRANVRPGALVRARSARVPAETLVIWGDRDPALGPELLDGLDAVVPGVRVHHLPHAGHWVQNEAPGEVNRVIMRFLARG